MENDGNIDQHMKELLQGLEVRPGIQSFDAIIRKMDKKKKRRRFIFFITTGMALLLVTLLLLPGSFYKPVATKTPAPEIGVTASNTSNGKGSAASNKKGQSQALIPANEHDQSGSSLSDPGALTKTSSMPVDAKPEVAEKEEPSTQLDHKRINKNALPETPATSYRNPLNTGAPGSSGGVTKDKTDSPVKGTVARTQQSKPGNEIKKDPPVPQSEPISESDSISSSSLEAFIFLPFIPTVLPNNFLQAEPGQGLRVAAPDSLLSLAGFKKKKKFNCYLGLAFAPQYNSFLLMENKDRQPLYDSSGGVPFSTQYLKGRKSQERFRLSYSLGLKLDLVFNDLNTISLGFGLQHYGYKEDLFAYKTSPSGPVQVVPPSNVAYTADPGNLNSNKFNYYYYSLEASRCLAINKWMSTDVGLGFRAEELKSADYIYVSGQDTYSFKSVVSSQNKELNPWLYTVRAKLGWKLDMGSRVRFKIAPAAYYSVNSMFKKDYVIRQKPYGMQLEMSLLLRLR